MQAVTFVSAHAGISKKGNEYSMVRLSDGIDSFIVGKDPSVDITPFHEGDLLKAEIHVSKGYGENSLKGTLVAVEEA